jgi:hypothetical protein
VRQPTNDAKSSELMEEHGVGYSSTGLVAQMRDQDNVWQQGEVKVKLAKAYGYCWGVERAVRMAYEAKNAFPDRRLHITNEIIHNPEVNQVTPGAGHGRAWGRCRRQGGKGGGRCGHGAARARPLHAWGSMLHGTRRQAAAARGLLPAALLRQQQSHVARATVRPPGPLPAPAACECDCDPPGCPPPPRPRARALDPLQRLRELDINIIEEDQDAKKVAYEKISEGDVVIFPAFGATVQVGGGWRLAPRPAPTAPAWPDAAPDARPLRTPPPRAHWGVPCPAATHAARGCPAAAHSCGWRRRWPC